MTDPAAVAPPPPAPAPKKSSKLRWAVRIVLLVVLVVVGGWFIGACTGNSRLKAIADSLPPKFAEARARKAERPVLRGAPQPGNAFDDYSFAIGELKGASEDGNTLSLFVDRAPGADAAKTDLILVRYGGLVDRLRQGAAKGSAQYPYVWEKGFTMELPSLIACRMLSNLAIVRAREAHQAGRSREAAEILLDDVLFGRDLCHNAVLITAMIGVSIAGAAVAELRDLVLAGGLSKEDLEAVARQLEILDGALEDSSLWYRNEVLGTQAALTSGLQVGELTTAQDAAILWKFGFISSLAYSHACTEYERILQGLIEASSKSWPDVQAASAKAGAESQASWNPLVSIMVPGLSHSDSALRQLRAHLRLVRAAAAHAATGTVPDLEDPFGAKIRSAAGPDGLKLWSVGKDGQDQNGSGGWRDSKEQTDIVLEVKKK